MCDSWSPPNILNLSFLPRQRLVRGKDFWSGSRIRRLAKIPQFPMREEDSIDPPILDYSNHQQCCQLVGGQIYIYAIYIGKNTPISDERGRQHWSTADNLGLFKPPVWKQCCQLVAYIQKAKRFADSAPQPKIFSGKSGLISTTKTEKKQRKTEKNREKQRKTEKNREKQRKNREKQRKNRGKTEKNREKTFWLLIFISSTARV